MITYSLAKDQPLPESHRDHELTGQYHGFRERHIKPDFLYVKGKLTENFHEL
jgi:mRNA interferase YafQ